MGVYFWTEYKWQPWTNTVAYRPLTSTTTVNDQSWNNYTLTQTGGSFTTLDGVDCFYNGWSTTGYFTLSSAPLIPIWNADRTISLWARPSNYSTSYTRYFIRYWAAGTSWQWVWLATNTNWKYSASVYWTSIYWDIMTADAWVLLTFTSSWNTFNFYVNGVLVWTKTATINTSAITSSLPLRLMRSHDTNSSSYQVRWYLSEVIIEDKTWTATEIANYFNSNKAKYWL